MDKVELKDETAILPNPCYVQCGDNLELLKSQPNESVNMIYCDILYGTGRNFGDYQDLKPIRSEIESHYLPRLIEMKRVLKQNTMQTNKTRSATPLDECRVYVGTYGKYNNGSIFGKWVER